MENFPHEHEMSPSRDRRLPLFMELLDLFPQPSLQQDADRARRNLCSPYPRQCVTPVSYGKSSRWTPAPRSFTFWTGPRHQVQWAIPANLDQRHKSVPLYLVKMDGKRDGHREANSLGTRWASVPVPRVSAAPASRGWG